MTTIATPRPTYGGTEDAVYDLLAGVKDRPPGHQLLQLGESQHAAGERKAAHNESEQHLDALLRRYAVRQVVQVLDKRDDRGGATSHAVEDGHHLRHRRHAAPGVPPAPPPGRPRPMPSTYDPVVTGVLVDKSQGDGHNHARDADQVAVAGVTG